MTRVGRGRVLMLLWTLSMATACVDESGRRNEITDTPSGKASAGDPQPMEALLDPEEWAGSTRRWIRDYVGSWDVDFENLELVEVGMEERKVVQLLGCAGNFVAAYTNPSAEKVRVSLYNVRAGGTSSAVWLTYANGTLSAIARLHGIKYRYGDLAEFSDALRQGRVNAQQVRERMPVPRDRSRGSAGLGAVS